MVTNKVKRLVYKTPFIKWRRKDKLIETEHGFVRYEVFCANEVKRMNNKMKVIYKGDKVCVD